MRWAQELPESDPDRAPLPGDVADQQRLIADRSDSDYIYGHMFSVAISRDAQADLLTLRAFDRSRVLDAIRRELVLEPTRPSRNRKLLEGLAPSWEHVPPIWEMRVGEFRVFFDVDVPGSAVYVRRVLRKGTKTTGEII